MAPHTSGRSIASRGSGTCCARSPGARASSSRPPGAGSSPTTTSSRSTPTATPSPSPSSAGSSRSSAGATSSGCSIAARSSRGTGFSPGSTRCGSIQPMGPVRWRAPPGSSARRPGPTRAPATRWMSLSKSGTSPSMTRSRRRRARGGHDARPARTAHGAPAAAPPLQVPGAPRSAAPGGDDPRALLRRLPRRRARRGGRLQAREERRHAHQPRALPLREDPRRLRVRLPASLDKKQVQTLATCRFIEHGENLLLLGPPGVGKTHLAVGLGLKAIEHGYRVLFTTAAAMIAKLTAALGEGKLEEKLKLFTVPRLLIVDEIGYLPIDRSGANLFFQLISRRYERGPMILTSNQSFGAWGDVFGDRVIATAILDRILHHAITINIRGNSYRLKD